MNDLAGTWTPVVQAEAKRPVRPGNRVDYLIDGWATYQSMYDAIVTTLEGDASGYFVYLLGWWLDDDFPLAGPPRTGVDEPGVAARTARTADPDSSLYALLRRAAARGVEIRVMLWDNPLRTGIPVLWPRGCAGQARRIGRLPGAAAVADPAPLRLQSHHEKLLLVNGGEGLIGFCGGIDIARDRVESVSLHTGSPFHDVHCRVRGPATGDLLDVFVERWTASAAVKKLAKARRGLRGRQHPPSPGADAGRQYVGVLRTSLPPPGKCLREASIGAALIRAIRASRRFIYLEDQYLTRAATRSGDSYLDVATVLGENLGRLEHVTVVIPHSAISDLPGAWAARLAFMEEVLRKAGDAERGRTVDAVARQRAGERLARPYPRLRVFFTYEPPTGAPRLDRAGRRFPKYLREDFGPGSYVHSKTWIFDDELAIIGSANCTRRSLNFDGEVAVAVFDRPPSPKPEEASFPQRLRVALWHKHLRLPVTDPRLVAGVDPAGGDSCWFTAQARRYVRLYNPGENVDQVGLTQIRALAEPPGCFTRWDRCPTPAPR